MSKPRILIIEDDPDIARLEADYLEIEGMQVAQYADGKLGLEMALKQSWDLILLDLMLPGMDGFEILRKLRDETEIPILMVSARGEDIDKIRALGLGADDYITKPFSPSELVARVKAHLKRYQRIAGKQGESDEIVIGSIVIQGRSHRVFVDGKEATLTTKEFELLQFLASNVDIIFSRELLFERIWGSDNYGDIGTVAVHIQKIRRKIEKDPANPRFIETVWGAGYRMNR
jgi:DNA-binding response OmpR family regulator